MGSGTMAQRDHGGLSVPNKSPVHARGPGVPQFGDGLQAAWPSKFGNYVMASSLQPPSIFSAAPHLHPS
jgi:hypothetical protein